MLYRAGKHRCCRPPYCPRWASPSRSIRASPGSHRPVRFGCICRASQRLGIAFIVRTAACRRRGACAGRVPGYVGVRTAPCAPRRTEARMTGQPQTLLDRLWSQHVVKRLSAAEDLIHVDRFFLHDLSGTIAIPDLRKRGLSMVVARTEFRSDGPCRLHRGRPRKSCRREEPQLCVRDARPDAGRGPASLSISVTPTRASCMSSVRNLA